MAFVTPVPQEEENQFAPTGQTTPNPLSLLPPQAAQTGGSAGQGGGASSGATAPGVGTPTQFGSTASKLSDYLTANQDQVQNMANQVSGQIGGQYNTVKSGVDQAGQTFSGQVSGGYTPTDPTLLSEVQSNPTSAAANSNKVSSFQKQLNDTYSGPSSFEGSDLYGGAQKNVTDAMQQAKLLGTYPGLSGYLQNNIETNPTPGQNTLDTVLLQSSQPAIKTVQDAATPFSGLSDYLANVATQQDQSVQAAQAAAPAAQEAAKAALGTATGNFNTNVNQEFNSAEGAAQNYNTDAQKYQAAITNDVPLVNQFSALMKQYGVNAPGVFPDIGTVAKGAMGAPPSGPSPTSASAPTAPGTVALPNINAAVTPQDFATLQALNTLSRTNVNSPLDPTQSNAAGTWKNPGSVDTSPLADELSNAYVWAYNNNQNMTNQNQGFVDAGNQWAQAVQKAYQDLTGNSAPIIPGLNQVFNLTSNKTPQQIVRGGV